MIMDGVVRLVVRALIQTRVRRWMQGWGYDIGIYPPVETSALRSHLTTLFSALKINCVIDVGANTGQFARMIRGAGFAGRIISFEPVRQNFVELSKRMAGDADWYGHQLALGSSDGDATINVTQYSVFSSFFKPNQYSLRRFEGDSEVVSQEIVQVRTLTGLFDSLLKGYDEPRVYLKLDTQGFDLDVLRGASAVLPSIAALQTELSMMPVYDGAPTYHDTMRFLDAAGYQATGFFAINRDQKLRATEFDCVCVRADI